MDFTLPADHKVKFKENEKRDKYLNFASEQPQQKMEYEGDGNTNSNWYTRKYPQRFGKGTGGLRNQRTSGDHPDCSIFKIDLNTEKSPVDLRRLAVTQNPIKDHRLAQV